MPKKCPDCRSEMEKIELDDEVIYKCTNLNCLIEVNAEHLEDQ